MTPAIKLEDLLSPAQISERDGKPILSPNKTEEISAITRYATEHKLAIEITGAGTKRSWGNPIQPNPVAADLLLSTTRLTGVREHSWQDLTATVGAGTTWAAMQRALAAHNQFVALDPLWPETATVGGILATNDSGPIRLKYGSLRDLVIGMTIVLADGTIARSGGKVVKNVAGYDLHKLMIGAHGTLGVITEVTFRLHPLPQRTQTFTVSAPQAAQLASLMAAIRDSHLLTEAMQLRGSSNGFHLDIQLNAHADAKQSDILRKVSEAAGFELEQPNTDVWQIRERLFPNTEAFVLKLTMPSTAIAEISDYLARCGAKVVAQSVGIALAEIPALNHYSVMDIEILNDLLEKDGGALTFLREPQSLQHDLKAVLTEQATLPLMREIKHQFDPNRILNPGRFLGGI